ncbi:MAG: hypothetical protein A6F71_08810 [Cycloclasticus sp. symbiont of Poecilosclerida sp. M]|nr:MAG: hypothetical protein A6F71_08810 [Cycloclasticus sp. symbiont of Poecilosclerida sp. M]
MVNIFMVNRRRVIVVLLCFVAFGAQAQPSGFDLPTLIFKAVASHASVKGSLSLEASAKQGVETARWQYFPTPEVSINQINTSQDDFQFRGDDRVFVISLSQPLWAGGRIDAGLEQSKAELMAAKSETQISRRDLALNVINAYAQWVASYLQYQVSTDSQSKHYTLQQRIKRRIKEGLSSSSDLNLVTSRLRRVEVSVNAAQARHESALYNLADFVGEPISQANLLQDLSTGYLISGEVEALREKALTMDPRLGQLLAEQKVAKAVLKQSAAQLSPELRLRLERQWGSFTFENADPVNRMYLELSSNFGAGLSSFSATKTAKFELQAAKQAFEAERGRLWSEFQIDWLSNESLRQQKKDLQSSVKAAKKIQQSWYRQFLVGRKDWQDVMNSIREVTQIESQAADIASEQLLTSWRLGIRIHGIKRIAQVSLDHEDRSSKVIW